MSGLDEAIRARVGALGGWDEIAARLAGALLAVLDLHADVEDGDGTHCAHCGPREIWPCPTVRAIAEKLGVEVDGG